MTSFQVYVSTTDIITGLLIMGISIPLWLKKSPMNAWYGVRVPEAYQSEESWYEINRYGGRELFVWSIPILFSGLVSLVVPISEENQNALALLLTAGSITVFVAIAVVRILIVSHD